MSDTEDREIIREPHPEVVRWAEYDPPWPADKPFLEGGPDGFMLRQR